MRAILDLEFKELMGRFGNWPTDASIQACEAIVRLAKQCPQGATFVDVGVTTGKTTVCLAHAAYRLNGKVIAVSTQTNQPILAGWFNRAMLLFKTTGYVVRVDGASEQADFILARESALIREIYANGLKPNGILFVLGNTDLTDSPALEKGIGYTAWRKEDRHVDKMFDKVVAEYGNPVLVGDTPEIEVACCDMKVNHGPGAPFIHEQTCERAPRLGSQTLASQVSNDSVTTEEQPKPMSGQRDNVGPYDEAVIRTVVGDTNGVQLQSTMADDRLSASDGVLSAAEGDSQQVHETPHDASASENTSQNGTAKSSDKQNASKQKVVSLLMPDKI